MREKRNIDLSSERKAFDHYSSVAMSGLVTLSLAIWLLVLVAAMVYRTANYDVICISFSDIKLFPITVQN